MCGCRRSIAWRGWSYEKSGFRTLIDLDYFQRLEDYPFMEGLRREARFQQLLARIRADNRRMREALRAPVTAHR